MLTVSYREFKSYVDRRNAQYDQALQGGRATQRVKVLRQDQHAQVRRERQLATCPACEFVVDVEILNQYSGLCPVCHEENRPG